MEIKETAITIDHDDGTIRVDTTSRKVATRLKRVGFEALGKVLGPYSSWTGVEGQILFRKKPGPRTVSMEPVSSGSPWRGLYQRTLNVPAEGPTSTSVGRCSLR